MIGLGVAFAMAALGVGIYGLLLLGRRRHVWHHWHYAGMGTPEPAAPARGCLVERARSVTFRKCCRCPATRSEVGEPH